MKIETIVAIVLVGIAVVILLKPGKSKPTGTIIASAGPTQAVPNIGGYYLNGDAKQLSSEWFQLTEDKQSKNGSVAWHINPGLNWVLTMNIQSIHTSSNGQGDGFLIGVYKNQADIFKFRDSKSGISFLLDEYNNNETSIWIGGTKVASGTFVVDDGRVHRVEIRCLSGKFDIVVDGVTTCSFTDAQFSFRQDVLNAKTGVWVTGSCGAATNEHRVKNIVFQSL